MDWQIIKNILNLLCSAITVALGTYTASANVEGSVVAGVGAAINHLRDSPTQGTPEPATKIRPNVFMLFAFLTILSVGFPIMGNTQDSSAATIAEWNRSPEMDVDHYNMYSCLTKGCTVSKASTKSANIPQVAVGVVPSWKLPLGEGAITVTATDQSGNESDLSNIVFFDHAAPAVVGTLRIK